MAQRQPNLTTQRAAHEARRALPTRSAKSPAMADPAAPLAIVANAIADPAGEPAAAGASARPLKLAAANAAIHVHTAYSSHMWPRYPSVASRAGRCVPAEQLAPAGRPAPGRLAASAQVIW